MKDFSAISCEKSIIVYTGCMDRSPAHRWEAAPQGSIRHPEALFELTEGSRDLLLEHPVIEIPKGILDHAALQLPERFRSNRVESDIGGARIHDHDWAVRLISTPATKTSTLIVRNAVRVAHETRQLIAEPKFRIMDPMSLPFQSELQHRLHDCIYPVDWSETDILIVGPGVLHCRDVRTLEERAPGEDLMVFSMISNVCPTVYTAKRFGGTD